MVSKNSHSHMFLTGLIVALSFLMQSITPTGFMPKLGSGKFFEITICHGAEQSTITVDKNMQPVKVAGNHDKGTKESDHSKPCVFASLSTKNLTLQSFLFQQSEILTYEEYVVRKEPHIYSIDSVHTYFSQGPPYILLQS